ncbi:purine-binding chemotaxis protein CheW [Bacillus sp. BRMEA1]|uniref:chemotaxis protein CheW n=1 Tax=Neobacillus endophyticus TaxID=2738405 RepID=UPI0015635E04|nr:chemotaxis protein CheW [Neobacillus endophyticus]NRD79372.1 purine-binding chemotaxis protein CheW [Neobacillus endophyticus]
MEMLKIVAFKIGEEEYGLDLNQVQSIERIQHITRVPNAPEFVKGVINLRGNVTPIIDLPSKLNLGEAQYTDSTRVIITRFEEMELGWIVDETNDVIDISPDIIEPASSNVFDSEYFSEIAKYDGRLISLLKLEELMKTSSN